MIKRFLSHFRGPDPRRLEAAELEARLRSAPRDSRAKLHNRLGDLYLQLDERDAAVAQYGLGIDAYLETGHFDPAAALCRKLINTQPGVIRARCTLAFLSLGKGFLDEAQAEIDDYVRAAGRGDKRSFAISRLRLMADATFSPEIRQLLARHLADLGDHQGAAEVLHSVAELERQPPLPPGEQREQWAQVLRQAVT